VCQQAKNGMTSYRSNLRDSSDDTPSIAQGTRRPSGVCV
jgi:hypothetical protein